MNLPIHFYITMLISIALMILTNSLEQNFMMKKLSKSNVECGFESMSKLSFKFSNQFFMISIVFLIFDMELIILMPLPISPLIISSYVMLMTIIILLTFSLLMEWTSGLIEWSKSQIKLY